MSKILIIEDDPILSKMYQKIFESENHEVIMGDDGVDGFEKAKTVNPEIILLDIMMPKMNGLQMLAKLKETEGTKNIPVVMLTNLAGVEESKKALALGALQYIIKSEFNPSEVEHMIKNLLIELKSRAVS